MTSLVVPLEGFMGPGGTRGWSYAQRTDDGQLHPGLDLNIGWGDEDLGLPVVALADGVVEKTALWDGRSYGFGNVVGVRHELPGGSRLWGVYAHLDRIDVDEGQGVLAGVQLGTVGKTGAQRWAHLHLELRWRGFGELPVGYWGGRLAPAEVSRRYADPFSLFRLAPAWNAVVERGEEAGSVDGAALTAQVVALAEALEGVQADRDYNFALKMAFEGQLRAIEGRRVTVKRGVTDRLIASTAR